MDKHVPPKAAEPNPASLWKPYAVCLLAALLLYALSVAPGVVWQDNGKAQIRVLERDIRGYSGLALSHPLYYAAAIGMQSLPFAESALKTNLVSVIAGAVTVANVFLILRLITGRWRGAAVGALSLAVAHTFWQHSSFAETYTLTSALLSTEFLLFVRYQMSGRPVWLIALFAANGLGISNHMLASLSLACYGIWLLWMLASGRASPVILPILIVAWLVGAGLYLYLIVDSILSGQGFAATIHSALFGDYRRNVLNLLPSRRLLMNSVLYLGLNYPTPAALLIIPGVMALRDKSLRAVRVMLTALLLVYLAYAVRYDIVDQYTFFVPALLFISLVMGLGADRFLADSVGRLAGAVLLVGAMPVIVYLLLPAVASRTGFDLGLSRQVPYRDEYHYFLQPWKTGYRGGEEFARAVERQLPDGAVLIADSTTVQPIHYMQLTERWHKRIELFPPLREHRLESTRFNEEALAPKLATGLVYVVTPSARYCPSWVYQKYDLEKTGVLHRVTGPKSL